MKEFIAVVWNSAAAPGTAVNARSLLAGGGKLQGLGLLPAPYDSQGFWRKAKLAMRLLSLPSLIAGLDPSIHEVAP